MLTLYSGALFDVCNPAQNPELLQSLMPSGHATVACQRKVKALARHIGTDRPALLLGHVRHRQRVVSKGGVVVVTTARE